MKTCEALAEFLSIDVAATSKAMPVTTDDGVVLALIRGDDRIEPAKLDAALGLQSRPSTDEEIRAAFGASGGSLGPVGFKGEVVADETLRDGQFVAGANRDGWHLRGVEAGRDFEAEFADLRESADGDVCPNCGGTLPSRRRSRSVTSSSSEPSTPRRSARASSTRTERSARWSWAATASGSRARWQRSSSRATTRTGSSGPRRSHRTMSTCWSYGRRGDRPSRQPRRCRQPARTCCWTTATSGRARSSPTPT